MSNFEHEERYIVVKLKDIDGPAELSLRDYLAHIGIPTHECVVVEPDWPVYEETWENVQRLAEGKPSIRQERDALAAHVEELRKAGNRAICYGGNETPDDWYRVIEQAPETSLTKRDAQKQAEAYRGAANMARTHGPMVAEELDGIAKLHERQAEQS